MDSTQLNLMAILAVLAVAGVFGVLVAVLSSRTLRHEGLRRVVKRWLR
jgi:VIT1/CCC1 family predicted Fe2+/Mn2+ transporter